MVPECCHIMPNGCKCHAIALRGKPYCYFHISPRRPARTPRPSSRAPLKFPVLDNRAAIKTAVTQVFDALSSSKIDPRRAKLLLYGLQIASQNVNRRRQTSVPAEKVEKEDLGQSI
jgi:hypothetical protein